MTSRIDGELESSMTSRSMPMPSPAGRRHAVLERAHVVLVHRVRFLRRRRRGRQLRLEATPLLHRIVQLAEARWPLRSRRCRARSARPCPGRRPAASTAATPRSGSRTRTWAGSSALPTAPRRSSLAILPAPAPLGVSTPSSPRDRAAASTRSRSSSTVTVTPSRFAGRLRRGVPQRQAPERRAQVDRVLAERQSRWSQPPRCATVDSSSSVNVISRW